MPQGPSTRWCPTPEQLMILEEMYRSGVRTPNASQIQQITAHLAYYGRIEGKNVFYWFQNHKARDRQKLRRRLSRQYQLLYSHSYHPISHELHLLDEAPPPPLPLHLQSSAQFHHQAGELQEATTQGLNLLRKLETREQEEEEEEEEAATTSKASTTYGYEWMVMMDVNMAIPPCCRPLKTLDLFPTKSTGLKDEFSASKSSSCSTTTS